MGILDALKKGYPSKGITAEDAMKEDLDSKFSNIEAMNDDVTKQTLKGKEQIKNLKINLLKKIYSEMRRMGVNPGNLEEVGAFLEKMEQIDPDLVVLFENAMSALDPMKESKGKPAPTGPPIAPEQMQPGQMQPPEQMQSPPQMGPQQPDLMQQQTENLQNKIMR